MPQPARNEWPLQHCRVDGVYRQDIDHDALCRFACSDLFRANKGANKCPSQTADLQFMVLPNPMVRAQPCHMLRALAISLIFASRADACETALLLSIDISGSIDNGEYAIQIDGLALALQEPAIVDSLVAGQMALAVVHWSGVGRQALVLPWKRMLTPADVASFAATVAAQNRAFSASDTSVGEAIDFSAAQFTAVPDCQRHVIDISGDGPENSGCTDAPARSRAQNSGIEINAIAIEDMGSSAPVTRYYQQWVITRGGFVMTARGLLDYPRAMREKFLREISKVSS